MRVFTTVVFLILLAFSSAAASESFDFRVNSVIGSAGTYKIVADESLIEVARKFDLGYNEITNANPALDPFAPGEGSSVIIPSLWVLPDVDIRDGIVIDLDEFRLYFFFRQGAKRRVVTYPIGIGSEGTGTPEGSFRTVQKIVNPAWHVPESIRKENPLLPVVVPPGPDNPLGSHALRTSAPGILIHGTNRPYAIGRMASHGCIRLYPEDIPKLFKMVHKQTPIVIVRQPVKIGLYNGRVFAEVHQTDSSDVLAKALFLLSKKHLMGKISSVKLLRAVNEKSGLPVDISQDAAFEVLPQGGLIKVNPAGVF